MKRWVRPTIRAIAALILLSAATMVVFAAEVYIVAKVVPPPHSPVWHNLWFWCK